MLGVGAPPSLLKSEVEVLPAHALRSGAGVPHGHTLGPEAGVLPDFTLLPEAPASVQCENRPEASVGAELVAPLDLVAEAVGGVGPTAGVEVWPGP